MMPRYEIVGNDGDVLQLYNIWGEQFLWLSTETLRRRAGWFTLNPTITGERISQKWLGHTYIHIYTVLYIWTYYGIRSGENTTPCPLQHLALFFGLHPSETRPNVSGGPSRGCTWEPGPWCRLEDLLLLCWR
jgi:hypothetical protein